MSDVVDLRSDTVTRPSAAMRKAMLEAEPGDDVFGDDPTVNRLQERAAELFGFEAALLVPSGAQSNLAAPMRHCPRGDEPIPGAVAQDMKVNDLSAGFDSVSSCLSKGLGAPAGTVLLGSTDFIQRARRARKILGGAMRQAGVIAAAGLYALENNVERLRIDHENAGRLARGLRELKLEVQHNTNMVMVRIPPEIAGELAGYLRSRGILVLPGAPLRLVAHLDVDAAGIDRALAAFGAFISSCPAGRSR